MKKITLLLLAIFFLYAKGYSQCATCYGGMHHQDGHSNKASKNNTGRALPPDSSGGLALSYLKQNVCGLNWEQSSVKVTTRYPTPPGSGLPATVPLTFDSCGIDSVIKAYLYFNGSPLHLPPNPATVTITNPVATVTTYSAYLIGTAGPKCWGDSETVAYRTDVTSCIYGGGNYTVNIIGNNLDAWSIDGITLVLIYKDRSAAYSGNIALWDGVYTTAGGGSHGQTLSGINVCNATPTGQAFCILADMQDNVSPTNTEIYNGSTGIFPNDFYNFCTVTTSLTAGQTSTYDSVYTNNPGDCYSWVLAGLYWQNTNCQTCVPTVVATNTMSIVPLHDTICQGDSIQLTASGDSSYIWAPATGLSCTNCPNPMASPNATTTYSVTGYIACAIAKDTVHVVVNPRGDLSVAPTSAQICPGGTVQLTASGGINYVWKPAASLTCSLCSNPIASPTVTTTYTVVSGSGGCVDSTMVTVTVGAPIPNAFASEPTICEGSSTTLFASGDSAFIWEPATTLSCSNCATTVATPTVTTTYTVIGIASAGCTDSTTVTVNVTATPTVTATPVSPKICSGASVLLTAAGATNYKWTPAGSLTCSVCTSPTASPTVTTTYTLIGATSGCRDTITDTVFVVSAPVAAISPKTDSICQGGTVLLTGSGGITYIWNNGQTTDTLSVAPTTTKIYTLVVSNGACTDTTTATINITPLITASISPNDTVCPGGPASITASASGGPATYLWSNNATTATINVNDSVTTTYTVNVIGKCNTVPLSKTIVVIPLAKPIITGTSWKCKGVKDTLTVSGGTSYVWQNGSTKTTYITGGINSDSTIKVYAFNSLGCEDSTTYTVVLRVAPTVTLNPPTLTCANQPVVLSANASGSGTLSYKWSPGGGTTSSITVTDSVATTYTVEVSNGCETVRTTTVTPTSPALTACCDKVILVGNDTIIGAFGSTLATYSWEPAVTCLNPPFCDTVQVSPSVTTTYTVTGTDSAGCQIERLVTIIVDVPCFSFTVPNVFTPNYEGASGVNNVFYIKTENITNWSISIFDRWGKEMFTSTNPNDYWPGTTMSGGQASDGVYYYIISGSCQSNTYKRDGFVQLIR